MGLLDRRAHPLVFVASLELPSLDPDDERHLRVVLRMGDGDDLTLADGTGQYRHARLGPALEPVGSIRFDREPDWPVAVGFSPVKGQRPEWMVQKLTELGVDRIVPIEADRAVVRWDDARAERLHTRMTKTAREACMQSRRVRLPTIEPLATVSTVAEDDRAVVLADPDGRPPAVTDRFVLVGPEGGWSDLELATATTAGAERVALPGGILRSETAVVVAGASLVGLRQGSFRQVG